MSLTPKRRAFVENYLKSWNATSAAREAGYSARSAYNQGYRLMMNDDIRAAIQERLAEMAMGADEVLQRLAQIARGEWASYLRSDGSFDLERMLADGQAHLVKSVRRTPHGLALEGHDMLAALVHIAKHHGLFVDRVQMEGRVNITPADVAEADRLLREFREEMAMAEQEGEVARG